VEKYSEVEAELRGVGMVWGIDFADAGFAGSISEECFKRGLIIETAGANGQVLKFLPALTIEEALISEGLEIIDTAIGTVLSTRGGLRQGVLA